MSTRTLYACSVPNPVRFPPSGKKGFGARAISTKSHPFSRHITLPSVDTPRSVNASDSDGYSEYNLQPVLGSNLRLN
jgi:hypothetical protein